MIQSLAFVYSPRRNQPQNQCVCIYIYIHIYIFSSISVANNHPDKRYTRHHTCRSQGQRRRPPARFGFDHPGHRWADQEATRVSKHVQAERQRQAVGIVEFFGVLEHEIRRGVRQIGHAERDDPYQSEPWFHPSAGLTNVDDSVFWVSCGERTRQVKG